MKKITVTVLLLCFCLCLCGCSGGLSDYVYSLLGIDNTDYSAEPVISQLELSSPEVSELSSCACILCWGDEIICFDDFSSVASDYVDIVLNYLAGTYYSKYSADEELMNEFSKYYPELSVNTLIPQKDYENAVYTAFGGKKKAVNGSTASYTYLDKIDAYLLTSRLDASNVTCVVYEASETEHTYRITAAFFENGETSAKYDILFLKREKGSAYMLSVKLSSKIIVVPETAGAGSESEAVDSAAAD